MEENIQNPSQPVQPLPIPQPSQKSHIVLFIILGGILLLFIATILAYFLGKESNKQLVSTIQPTHSVSPFPDQNKNTAVVSPTLATGLSVYTNPKYGFQITYPTTVKGATSCTYNNGSVVLQNQDVPQKVFDDQSNNTAFIAPSIALYTTEGSLPTPPANQPCQAMNIDIPLLEKLTTTPGIVNTNIDNPYPQPSYAYNFEAIAYLYAPIMNDADLVALAEKSLSPTCDTIDAKTAVSNESGVYRIQMKSSKPEINSDGSRGDGYLACGNYSYDYLYSPSHHVAIFGNTRQNCDVQSIGGFCGAQITFP